MMHPAPRRGPQKFLRPGCRRAQTFMKENKEARISYWAAHFTTIVSVTLVLVTVGVIALLSLGAARETKRIKERLELSVVMADTVSDSGAGRLCALLARQPYVLQPRIITRAQALRNWEAETGENLEETFGVNPLSPEVAFFVAAPYAAPASMDSICKKISALPGVEGVAAPDASMVESMNSNIGKLTVVLGVVGAVLLVISFVLINNTVHLSIHSRRFTIHTMQLVGATDSFIRAPFLRNNLLCGLISGALASGLIALTLAGAPRMGLPEAQQAVTWGEFGIVAGGLTLLGAALCLLAAAWACTRFLRKDYGQLVNG